MSCYCDLCGSVSSLYGFSKRTLVVFDAATMHWLFAGAADRHQSYPSYNCVKGGASLHPQSRPEGVRKFIASFSVLAASVKLFDDRADTPGLRTNLLARFAEPAYQRALAHAGEAGLDVPDILEQLELQTALEKNNEPNPVVASQTTAHCYGKVARVIASANPSCVVSADEAQALGEYLGRCVYLFDAFRDRALDAKSGAYNPFLCGVGSHSYLQAHRKEEFFQILESFRSPVEELVARFSESFATRWRCIMRNLINTLDFGRSDRLYLCCVCPCCGGHVAADEGDLKGCFKCCCWLAGCCCCLAVIGGAGNH